MYSELPHWYAFFAYYAPYVVLAMLPLYCVKYFVCYYEFQPESLDYRWLWRRRSIPYNQITSVSVKARVYGVFMTVYYAEGKTMKVLTNRPFTFFDGISAHAPQVGNYLST
jgi:hypothetical protein